MCAMDARWRCYGYHAYPSSIPAVNLIKIVLEDRANEFISKSKCKDITVITTTALYTNVPTFPMVISVD